MKVKQLIYTSWKNGSSTKKGFMVYSQSEGLSADDVNLITRNMRYITLSSLPYSPTWEEIETLFPRNDAYFQLPSGSWCMAQSSYLGKDYSGRLGNYIIHAYIAPQKLDFDAINLIGSDVYRRSLTEAELEAESNPPALPEVELVCPDVSGDVALLKTFFNGDRIAKLRYLVSAVLRAVKNNECVYLNDEKDNLPMWYKALNFCLPADILSKVTYATYSCVMADGITIQSVKTGGSFNYRQQLASGALVYDFKDNVINDGVEVGNFVNKIIDEFAVNPLNAKARINALGNYITEANGDLDLAVELSWFYEGQYNRFPDPASLKHIFNVVTAGNRLEPSVLAQIFGDLIIGNQAFPIADFPDMYKYILINGDKKTYYAVVAQYVGSCTSKSGDVSSYDAMYDDAVKNSPFDWRSFLEYIIMCGGKTAYINKFGAQSYPAYLLAVSEINYGNPPDEQLVTLYARTIARINDLTLFKTYLNRLSARGMKERICEKVVAGESVEGGVLAGIDYDKTYALLDAIAIDSLTIKTLLALLGTRYDAPGFMDKFSKYIVNKPEIYAGVEKAASYNASAKRYVDSMICDRFLAKTPDENSLNDFYNKYFQTSQQMREVFLQGLENYLNSLVQKNPKAKIHACLAWFNKINKWYLNHPIDTARMGKIEAIVKNTVFNADFDKFCDVYKSETAAVIEFANGYVARNHVSPCEHLDVIALGTKFEEIDERGFKSSPFLNEILGKRSIGNYDQKTLRSLADHYFDDIFRVFVALAKSGECNWAIDYANVVIIPLADICRMGSGYGYGGSNSFGDNILRELKELSDKDLVRCLPVLVNASLAYPGISPLSEILDKYVGTYKRKKLQSLYDEILHDAVIRVDKSFKKYMEDKIATAKRGLFDRKDKGDKDEKEGKAKGDDKARDKKNKK